MAGEIILSEVSTPSTPAATKDAVFVSNDATPRLKRVNSAGSVMVSLENNVAMPAGTTSIPPFQMTSGSNTTSALAGAQEFDGTAFYSTPVAGARGLSPSTMFSIVPSGDFSLATAAGVQSAFPTTGDVWTLAATTAYFFEGIYYITKTTGSITTALAFATGGGSSVTSIGYFVEAMNVAADTTTATVAMTWIDTISSTVINAAATTALAIKFSGVLRMNAAGTITPQINFSNTATAPVMKVNSFIRFTPLGTNTTNILGNVG